MTISELIPAAKELRLIDRFRPVAMHHPGRPIAVRAIFIFICVALAGCQSLGIGGKPLAGAPVSNPPVGSSQIAGLRVESKAVATPPPAAAAQSPGDVAAASPADAVRAVNAYRTSKRRGPVAQNSALNAAARAYAAKLAGAGKITHTLNGSTLVKRLAATGYEWGIAAENLGGGYRSLNHAMIGWKTSKKGHNKILLRQSVTELGFAMKTSATGRYRSYWVLVLASPGEPGGPQAFMLVPH